jgi:hypothetical protein
VPLGTYLLVLSNQMRLRTGLALTLSAAAAAGRSRTSQPLLPAREHLGPPTSRGQRRGKRLRPHQLQRLCRPSRRRVDLSLPRGRHGPDLSEGSAKHCERSWMPSPGGLRAELRLAARRRLCSDSRSQGSAEVVRSTISHRRGMAVIHCRLILIYSRRHGTTGSEGYSDARSNLR